MSLSELDSMIATLRALGSKDVEGAIAARVGPELLAAVQATLAAGTDPEGEPWEPKLNGGRAYKNAAKRVSAAVMGNLVRLTLTGPEVWGQIGVRGRPVRQMLPDAGAGVPRSVSDAISRAAAKVIEDFTK